MVWMAPDLDGVRLAPADKLARATFRKARGRKPAWALCQRHLVVGLIHQHAGRFLALARVADPDRGWGYA